MTNLLHDNFIYLNKSSKTPDTFLNALLFLDWLIKCLIKLNAKRKAKSELFNG